MSMAKNKQKKKPPVKQDGYKPKRNDKGQLLPGHTANPNGRPSTGIALSDLLRGKLEGRLSELLPEEYAQDKRTVNEAIADTVIKEVLSGRDPIKAAALVFDRLEGKAPQSIALKHEGRLPIFTGDPEEYIESAISKE